MNLQITPTGHVQFRQHSIPVEFILTVEEYFPNELLDEKTNYHL